MQNTPIVDILEPIVADLGLSYTSSTHTYNAQTNLTFIELCCTGYLRPCSNIQINGLPYSIEGVTPNVGITIKGNLNLVGEVTITSTPPFYFHGTIINTSKDVVRIRDGHDKYPMVYLYEPISERYFNSESPIEYEVEVRLFFLDLNDFKNWKTDEHYLYSINPMRYLALEFINRLNKDRCTVNQVENYKLTSYANIGTEILETGVIKSIFANNLSGVELILTIQVLKSSSCKKCNC
jgi:hypothetical protein